MKLYFKENTGTGNSTLRNRENIAEQYKWQLGDIYPDWGKWQTDYKQLEGLMEEFVKLRGTLSSGADQLLKAYTMSDEMGKISYKIYRYPQLMYDLDQRDNDILAKLQQVEILFARFASATAWLNPEILTIPIDNIRDWIEQNKDLAVYRFPIEELFRQQEHVLDEDGERLLSYSSRFNGVPGDTYEALTTADAKFNTITLSTGEEVTVTHAQYMAILQTNRNQEDRAAAFEAMYDVYDKNINTYASLYNGVCQRDWFKTQARKFETTLNAALDGNNIPVSVFENLVSTARAGNKTLQRYHILRQKVLEIDDYHLYDGGFPIVDFDKKYPYDDVLEKIVESVGPLGKEYQDKMREGFAGGWIDVYESEGKRSGAYSAGVYGVHPFMLLNYNDTLNEVFTLAHEMGHTMHTVLSHENQPFATSEYTIFVAEVASTLNEALLLDYMLKNSEDTTERIVLLQHAIDGIVGTFFTQVMFADYERQVHKLVEDGHPVTSDVLNNVYIEILKHYYGDVLNLDELYRITWARIPHFYRAPYYVYQYATCFASSARLIKSIKNGNKSEKEKTISRYLDLLKSGGNDHPMVQLKKAGVDLEQAETVQAVIAQLDSLVTQLEEEINNLD